VSGPVDDPDVELGGLGIPLCDGDLLAVWRQVEVRRVPTGIPGGAFRTSCSTEPGELPSHRRPTAGVNEPFIVRDRKGSLAAQQVVIDVVSDTYDGTRERDLLCVERLREERAPSVEQQVLDCESKTLTVSADSRDPT